MKSLLNSLLQIGDRSDDPHDVMLMHHFLVAMGVFMNKKDELQEALFKAENGPGNFCVIPLRIWTPAC